MASGHSPSFGAAFSLGSPPPPPGALGIGGGIGGSAAAGIEAGSRRDPHLVGTIGAVKVTASVTHDDDRYT